MTDEDWSNAFVPESKVTAYLLALDHPVGGSKALVLRGAGFHPSDPKRLAVALIRLAQSGHVAARVETPHGSKLVIDGVLLTPGRRKLPWRTVWIVASRESAPRLVTAYPIGRHRRRG